MKQISIFALSLALFALPASADEFPAELQAKLDDFTTAQRNYRDAQTAVRDQEDDIREIETEISSAEEAIRRLEQFKRETAAQLPVERTLRAVSDEEAAAFARIQSGRNDGIAEKKEELKNLRNELRDTRANLRQLKTDEESAKTARDNKKRIVETSIDAWVAQNCQPRGRGLLGSIWHGIGAPVRGVRGLARNDEADDRHAVNQLKKRAECRPLEAVADRDAVDPRECPQCALLDQMRTQPPSTTPTIDPGR